MTGLENINICGVLRYWTFDSEVVGLTPDQAIVLLHNDFEQVVHTRRQAV